jgi:hypothetical protein
MTVVLTEQERDMMAHAIGHHSAKGCSVHGGRNRYVTAADDPVWCSLVERGLARRSRSSLLGETDACFHVTDTGIAAVEADPRSARKGKPYTVRFKGYDHGTTVYAETPGKAKYMAVLDVLDAFNMTAREAFTRIESCRRGYS